MKNTVKSTFLYYMRPIRFWTILALIQSIWLRNLADILIICCRNNVPNFKEIEIEKVCFV